MIDYGDIGRRVKEVRISKGVTQEELAEACNVGTPHISHIETGHTVPSMKVFLSIVNYLDCSADALLCKEVATARPMLNSWLSELVEDCDAEEVKIISDMVIALKRSMRLHQKAK